MRLALGVMLALLSTNVFSSEWHCRNKDMEIHCDANKCEASDALTPFDIRVSTKGLMSICAYSGCWEGKGKVLKSGEHILMSGNTLKWTGNTPGSANFMVAVDTADKAGFIKGEGFAMPITCLQK